MKRFFLFSTILISGLLFAAEPQPVQAASGITYGPYIQRVSENAATVIIQTDDSEQLTLKYRELGKKWKTLTDAQEDNTHRYRLTGLKRNTRYEYLIKRGNRRISQIYSFTTTHLITKNTPLKIAAVGDSGLMNTDTMRVVSQMQQWKPELILHTGDIAYDNGTTDDFIAGFFKPYQALIANVPLYPAMGNHEFHTGNGRIYKEVFEMPKSTGSNEDYYSFNIDSVHIVSLNTNLDYAAGSKMNTWLQQDLAASKHKWKIVIFHHPPYSSGTHGGDTAVAAALSPIFESNGVDLVLNGHDHVYERNQEVNGVEYIVTGGGGRSVYSKDTSNPYSAKFVADNHFVGLKVYPDKISLTAIDKRGYEIDSYTIR